MLVGGVDEVGPENDQHREERGELGVGEHPSQLRSEFLGEGRRRRVRGGPVKEEEELALAEAKLAACAGVETDPQGPRLAPRADLTTPQLADPHGAPAQLDPTADVGRKVEDIGAVLLHIKEHMSLRKTFAEDQETAGDVGADAHPFGRVMVDLVVDLIVDDQGGPQGPTLALPRCRHEPGRAPSLAGKIALQRRPPESSPRNPLPQSAARKRSREVDRPEPWRAQPGRHRGLLDGPTESLMGEGRNKNPTKSRKKLPTGVPT